MKRMTISFQLVVLMSMIGIQASAHDIEVANSQGKTIYYVWTNDNTELAVSYRGSDSWDYSDEYTGSVVIPATVTYGGQTYPVTSIGERAFASCSSLTSVSIPSSVTNIGEWAFASCSSLTSVAIEEGVTSIGEFAFCFCSSLTSVTIPSSVTTIGEQAFSYSGLTSVTIPSSVTSIGRFAFEGCRSLTSVFIEEGVTSIGICMFRVCTSLTSVTIPSSVTSIGSKAFNGCSGLTSISVASGNSNYDSRNNCNALIETSSNTLIVGCKNTIIPNSVTSIGDQAFLNCSGLSSIAIPNSVTSIGSLAFYDCSGLTSIAIPNSVSSIGERAFDGCSGLMSISVASGNSNYDSRNNCNAIIETSSNTLIVGCKNTIIPNSVTSIGDYAFCNCSGLTSITIPSSVTSIGDYAFQYCSLLTSVTIPSSVTSIGRFVFEGTAWFNNQPDGLVYIGKVAYRYKGTMPSNTSIILKDGTLGIAGNAFENCYGLTSVTIPSSVTNIGPNAFMFCDGLTSVAIPSSVTSIGGWVFNGSGLTSVTIPSSVTSIGESVFGSCSNLTSISVASGNSYYDSRNDCNAIIETASNTLIASCKNTVIPNTVTSIGNYAFYGCSGLTSVTIPSSMTSIGYQAFAGCPFVAFICKATTPPSLGLANEFGGKKKIYVPYSSMDAYRSAWTQLAEPTYTYLPLVDVMLFENQTAESYAAALNGKDKAEITSVAFYGDDIDETLTVELMKNGMNPNCLYYLPASAGLSGENIVSLDSYEAESVTLTDDYTYDCPVPFHTDEIKYVHNPSVWANGSAGWETICLPFEPDSYKASERGYISPIMLGSTGDFWLRKFVGASSDAVHFASTLDGRMEANTPYLVAFPGSSMGTGHLEGQTITFQGHDAYIAVTRQPEIQKNDFVFVGNYDTTADGEGWALNAVGSAFTKNAEVGTQPFRAYFKNLSGDVSSSRLRISFSEPTDIRSLATPAKDFMVTASSNGTLLILSESNRALNIYGIDGRLERRVELSIGENRVDGLHKGLYIVESQKVNVR